ncbi:Sesquipedalian-1 [Bagarius yarrelli]|uniref:Sesquipedalian n=1 Tax=Bagarius yarrelli TaxID=175774 RepID=A0A556UZI7_BAGYA|nr:Sesquipedalian-1 [Bagarius yarrelli]
MKIHRRILTHYLSCTSPVDKEGYLYKKRGRKTSYLRRWFVLKGNLLFYQERPADRALLGVIVLEGCVVQTGDSDISFSLVFTGPGLRTYQLAAEDQPSQKSWVNALLSASHIYTHLASRPGPRTPLQRAANKRSPKHWPKRNAHVTPLNGPAPKYGEWPLVGFDPMDEFVKLHEYYGNEVKQVRADWLKKKQQEAGHIEENLIDLG